MNRQFLEPLADGAPFEASFAARPPRPPGGPARILSCSATAALATASSHVVVRNYGLEPCDVVVELLCDTDFAGLFEVKEDAVRPPACRCETGRACSH